MAQFVNDLDEATTDKKEAPATSGKFVNDLDDEKPVAEKPSLWQRAKNIFTSEKPKTMTVQPDQVKEPPPANSDLRELYEQDPVVQGKPAPKQMTVGPEPEGLLTRAAKTIQKNLGAQPRENLVGIHDKELSFRQGSESDFYPEISAGTKESVKKLEEGAKKLTESKQKLETWQPPKELKAAIDNIAATKKKLDEITSHAVDKKLPADLYKKYTILAAQHKEEVKKYNDLLKGVKGDYQTQLAEYNRQVNEFNARKLRLSIAAPDQEEKPSLIQHIARSMGVDKTLGMDVETSTKRREAIENAKAAVDLAGGKVESDDVLMQAIKSAGNESALGLPKAILEAQGEVWEEPKTIPEKVAAGAGTLIGFIAGAPGKITGMVEKGVINLYPKMALHGADSALVRAGKEAAYKISGSRTVQSTIGLAAGFSSAAIGEALSKDNIDDALKVLAKAAESGAVMGGTFAGVKGLIPGEAPLDKIKRIATGLAIFDLERGNQPFDERQLNAKIMDYGMDAYFLWHGLPNQERGLIINSMDDILTKLNSEKELSGAEIRKLWKGNPDAREELLKKYAGVKERPVESPLRPAVLAEDGTLYVAKGDQNHDAIRKENNIKKGKGVFVDDDGNVHDREKAKDVLEEKAPEISKKLKKNVGKKKPLHTEDLQQATKEAQDAIEEREKPKSDIGEHQGDGEGGTPAEAGGGRGVEQSRKRQARSAEEIAKDIDKLAPEAAVSKGKKAEKEALPTNQGNVKAPEIVQPGANTEGKGLLYDQDVEIVNNTPAGTAVRFSPLTEEATSHAQQLGQTLPKGTILVGSDGVKFRIDETKSGKRSLQDINEDGNDYGGGMAIDSKTAISKLARAKVEEQKSLTQEELQKQYNDLVSKTTPVNQALPAPLSQTDAATVGVKEVKAGKKDRESAATKPIKAAPAGKPTVLIGTYTSRGDTAKDLHENGSQTPERKFKADLKNYAKKLQNVLGYEPNIETKGKKSKKTVDNTVSTNIAPIGGDGHIMLWKPNSEYGIYIQVGAMRDAGNDSIDDFGHDKITIGGLNTGIMYRVNTRTNRYSGGGPNRYADANISAEDFAERIQEEVDFYDRVPKAEEIIEEARDNDHTETEITNAAREGEKAVPVESPDLKEGQIIAEIEETDAGIKEISRELNVKIGPSDIEKARSVIENYVEEYGKDPYDLEPEILLPIARAYGTLAKYGEEDIKTAWQMLENTKIAIEPLDDADQEEWQPEIDKLTKYLSDIEQGQTDLFEKPLKKMGKVGDPITADEREVLDSFYEGKKTAEELGEKQKLTLTAGPAGAGKSTTTPKKITEDHVHSNSDLVREKMGRLTKEFHERASELAELLLNESIGKGYHTLYDSQLTNYGKVKKVIEKVLIGGGDIILGMTDISAETSIVRSRVRDLAIREGLEEGEPRDVPVDVSIKGYNYSLPTFIQLYNDFKGDERVNFVMANNNVDFQPAKRVFSQTAGALSVDDKDLFDKAVEMDYIKVEGEAKYVRQEPATAEGQNTAEIDRRTDSTLAIKRNDFREKRAGLQAAEEVKEADHGPEGRKSGEGTSEDDQAGVEGQGAEDLPPVGKGGKTGSVSKGSRRADDGQLRQRGSGSDKGLPEAGDVSGKPAKSDNGEIPVVGGNSGNLPGIQRQRRGTDHVIEPGSIDRSGSWFSTAKTNLDIIELIKKLDAEKRLATPEEQQLLAKYVGWGASEIANNMFPGYSQTREIRSSWQDDAKWREQVDRLVALMTPEEIATAARSTQYAHYTSPAVITSIHKAVARFGFPGGKMLEPGMGIGSFFGLMPAAMRDGSVYTGIEFDGITAKIAQHLYPNQNIIHGDYTKQRFPNDFFDIAIGNPPFSSTKILTDPDYKKMRLSLHDYFFVKSLDKVRPGGLLVFITSRYTMDKQSDKVRNILNERADLLGAIRMPQTAFKQSAGTEVVTDVIFLRKKVPGEATDGKSWKDVTPITTPEGEFPINEYFIKHPEMVLGTHSGQGSMYGKNEYTVLPKEGMDIESAFDAATQRLPEKVFSVMKASPADQQKAVIESDFNPTNKKEGGLYVSEKGDVMITDLGRGVPVESVRPKITPTDKKWLKDYVGLRDAVKAAQYDQLNDGEWEKSLESLKKLYSDFVKKHGRINEFKVLERKSVDDDGEETIIETRKYKNVALLRADVESPLVWALEVVSEDNTISDGPFLKGRTIKKPEVPQIKTVPDALAVSLSNVGRLDINDIAALIDKPANEVIDQLGDLIYETPEKGGEYILADEYLSEDVKEKLEVAKNAAKIDPKYERNVDALQDIQPAPLLPKQIAVTPGSSWIPLKHYNDFVHEVMDLPNISVRFSPADNQWELIGGGGRQSNRGDASQWSTLDRGANEIFKSVLNNSTIKVHMSVPEPGGGTKQVIDPIGTAAANDIAKKMRARFKTWVWEDAARARDLQDRYNAQKNTIVPRSFDGKHLTLPGVSLRYKLLPHQKNAIWRVIQDGNTYIYHAVGAGKTYEMVAAGMEMKRLGLINKPLYVVPNHMLRQFSNEFQDLYPMAHIMVADEENFHTTNRKRFMAQAGLNNPDAVVITHSSYGLLKMKAENIKPVRDKIIAELIDSLDALREDKTSNRIRIKQMEKRIEQVEQRFDSMIAGGDNVLTFEDMGVDFLFVDEAHNFRKLDFTTNRQAKGVDPNGSRRAMDLFIKIKWLETQKPGRSHVFASGTPVTNTLGEIYTIMKFFMEDGMEKEGTNFFDAWANEYGEMDTKAEMNAAGRYEMVDRFSKFNNLQPLMQRVLSFMDVLTNSQLGGFVNRPTIKGGQPNIIVTPPSEELKAYQDNVLQPRIVTSKAWKPSADQKGNPDPMINIITDGRLASIDLRFVVKGAKNDPNSKLNKFIDQIIEKHKETKDNTYLDAATGKESPIKGGGVICFYNHGFGKMVAQNRGFDARAWAMDQFRKAGIKASEVAWIDNFDTAAKKEAMFKEMRNGTKRILIGSAKKMGTGMNVQTRLANLVYLDPPWYPADVEQPLGRIVRQGNQNKEVGVGYLATKGSYDSTMWGMVQRKSKFIEDLFSGKGIDSMEDISSTSLYEMAAAISSGDERAIQLAGLNADIDNLENLRQNHFYTQNQLAHDKDQIERKLPKIKDNIKNLKEADEKAPYISREIDGTIGKKIYTERKEFGEAIVAKAQSLINKGEDAKEQIGEISGLPVIYKLWRGEENINVDENGKMTKSPGNIYSHLIVKVTDKISYQVAEDISANTDPVGLVAKIANRINGVSADLSKAESELDDNETNLKKINSRLGAPFEFEAELNEKTAEAAQITHALETEATATAAPAATEEPTGPNAKKIKALQDNIKELDAHLPGEKKGSAEYNRLLEVRKGFEDEIKALKEEKPDFPAAPMGIDPTQTLKVLRGLRNNIKEAMPHLEELGRSSYQGGKRRFTEWQRDMKSKLGDLWESFKKAMRALWNKIIKLLKFKGDQRGAVGRDIKKKWKDVEGLTEEQTAARARIERDVKILSANANEAGLSFPDYLKSIGLDDARVQRLNDYVNSQPVLYPDYREVVEGEALEPGADVIMDMASGKSFVRIVKTTGIKNRVTLEEREKKGQSEVEVEIRRNFGKTFDEGKRLVDSGERHPDVLAEEIAAKPRPLSAEESVILIYGRMKLQNEHGRIMDMIEEAIEDGDLASEMENRQRLAKIEDDINTNDEAARRSGYEQGLGLAARRMMIMDDYSLARNLQRARVANNGELLTDEIRQKITDLTNQLKDANLSLQKYDEEAAIKAAQKEFQKIKNSEVVKKYALKAKEHKTYVKEELDKEFSSLARNLNESLGGIHFIFDADSVRILAQMTKNRVLAGVNSIESIVDYIHDQTKDDYPDITKRDIRDAISGYGRTFELSRDEIETQLREIKRQARLISAYEDATAGQVPLRSGFQRDPLSDKVREMGRQVKQAMREAGIDSASNKTPEEQWKTSLDSVKTRLRNQITDLTKQLETGKKTPKKIGIEYDEEANSLKSQRDSLSAALIEIEGKPQMSPEQKIKMATAAVEKSIAEYERRIKEKDLAPQKKVSTTPETPELKTLREQRDQLKAIYKELQDEARPKLTPEEIALKSFKTRTANRIAELEEKLRTKDYAKKPRKKLELDPEAQTLKANVERIKNNIENDIQRIKLANRTKLDKLQDFTVKWRRFVILSSITTVGKLTVAASSRFVTSPLEDLASSVWRYMPGYSQIMSQSPRYSGGLSVRAEAKAFSQFVQKQTYKDMWETIKTGKGELDVLYSPKHGNDLPPEALSFFGHLHGALKVTPKRAEFFRSLEKRSQWAIKQGMDITDPVIQMTLCADAYNDANRAILMQKNWINDLYTSLLRQIEHIGSAGKVGGTVARVLLPIVRVPTNFALETFDYAFGAPKGTIQVIRYLLDKDALRDLKPEQANNIARSLSKGLVGIALLMIGYYNRENLGGFYEPGEKRKPSDVKWGYMRIYGHEIPPFLLHVPAFAVLQMGATIGRTMDYYAERMKGGGAKAGAIAASKGMLESIPFTAEPQRIARATKDAESAAKFAMELITSMAVPPDVGKFARLVDTDEEGKAIPRKPETAADVFKLKIPGLRQDVPENVKKEKQDLKAQLQEDLRDDPAAAQQELAEAIREKKITKKEAKDIKKEAKQEEFVNNVKHLSLEELAKRIKENATDEQKAAIYPVFKKKFQHERKKLDPETKREYYDLMEEMRE